MAVGAGDFGEEGAEFAGIFFAGAGFDAAGYIHGVGAGGDNGFSDIFRREAAGENDAMRFCSSPGYGPIEGLAGAAELIAHRGVEEKRGRSAEPTKLRHRKAWADAEGLEHWQIILAVGDLLGRFVAVQLDRSQFESVYERDDEIRSPVDENTDCFGGRFERFTNLPRVGGRDYTRRLFVEIEADRPGAEFLGEACVLSAGNAADFDAGYGLVCHEMALRLELPAARVLDDVRCDPSPR